MPKYTKPADPNIIWASDALPADVVKPENSKISQGWIQEKPPLEIENWLKKKLFLAYAYYNQLGFPEWDKETEYQAGKSYVQGSDGIVYKAIVTNTNENPAGSGRDRWEIAFVENRAISTYARTLVAATSAAQARQLLGLGSASGESDDKYLHRANNLSDLSSAQTAFNNIKQNATTTRTGVVELATRLETADGIRDDLAVTPNSLGGGINPSGTIITFAGSTAPTGYLPCDGRVLSRNEFPELFEEIGTLYGSTNSDNFKVPDTRGVFVRGWDNGRGVDSNRSLGSEQADSFRSHTHSGNTAVSGEHGHTGSAASAGSHTHSGSTNSAGNHTHSLSINAGGYHTHSGSTNSAGNHTHQQTASRYTESSSNLNYTGRENHPSATQATSAAGAHTHGLSINANGSHSHSGSALANGSHSHSIDINANGSHTHSVNVEVGGSHSHSFTTDSTGGNETRPMNIAFLCCIKT